jgi:hypothetical protein
MYKSVRFDGKKLSVNHADYLKKHNIVYETPAYRGHDGLPIGNGDMGGMIFHTERSIVFHLNKTDVIDFAPDGNFEAWSWRAEEKNTAPVSCGRLSITDSMPSFNWLYLEDYNETLSLSKGVVSCRSKTPFSHYDYRAYASQRYGVIVFEVSAGSAEAVERKIMLEKWGSVNMFHDYEQIKPVYAKNLFNVKAGEKNNAVYLEQQLNGTHYTTAMRVLGCPGRANFPNSRSAEFILEKADQHDFTVLLTVAVSHNGLADGRANLERALQLLDDAEKSKGVLYESHRKAWADFWEKSLVCLPNDDFLENIYYMNLYQLGSCGLGKYPPTFAGLWNWHADTRNWWHFYHWNHQQTYWGVYAAGHKELAENYLEYRFNMLENAKADAAKLFGCENGAFYSDISNFNGYNALEPDTVRNFTPGAQIALDFYRYYIYTLDENFLRQKACPVMRSVAALYVFLLQKGEDGFYRIKGGASCCESYWNLRETVTDFACIHALFGAMLEIAETAGIEKAETEKYREIKDNLYPLPVTKTKNTDGDKELEVISPGIKWDGLAAATAEGDYPLSPFPLCELLTVYPSGYISLAKKGTKEFELAQNTARLLFDMDVYAKSKIGSCGHSVAVETAARLGMHKDCAKILRLFAERYQQFPNALTHFTDISDMRFRPQTYCPRVVTLDSDKTEWEKVHEKKQGPRAAVPNDYFLHCYFESAANIMAGVNEMLLQSHDGIIRVFPAVEENFTGIFTLYATAGFKVTSEMSDGEIRYVHITSEFSRVCTIEIPWPDTPVSVTRSSHNGESAVFSIDRNILSFDAVQGGEYLIMRCEYPLDCYYREDVVYTENTVPKEWRSNTIGRFGFTKGRVNHEKYTIFQEE